MKPSYIFAYLLLLSSTALAKDFYIQSFSVSSFGGMREVKIPQFAFTGEPDFANYIYQSDTSFPDYAYNGIAGNIVFGGGIAIEGRTALYSGMTDSYIGIRYYHKPWLSYSLGYFSTGYWRSRVTRFQYDAELAQYSTQTREPNETATMQDRGA